MTKEATTIASWASAVARTLERYDCNSRELFKKAGLDWDVQFDADGRYSVQAMTRLGELSVEATGDACFGLEVHHYVNPSSFQTLGMAVISCATMLEGLQCLSRYSRLISDVAQQEVFIDGEVVTFRFNYPLGGRASRADEAIDAMVTYLVTNISYLVVDDVKPEKVCLQRPKPDESHRFEEYYGCPVAFSCEYDEIIFSLNSLLVELPSANPLLAEVNEKLVLDYLARFDQELISAKVRAQIIELLPRGKPSQREIAQRIGLSPRCLQRKLQDESITFSILLSEARHEMAKRYLQQRDMTLIEITFLLGFSDQSNFSKAFKQWEGVSPGGYRTQLFS